MDDEPKPKGPPAELNLLRVRRVAAKYEIHEMTLRKALRGEPIRGASVASRTKLAVQEYHQEEAETK